MNSEFRFRQNFLDFSTDFLPFSSTGADNVQPWGRIRFYKILISTNDYDDNGVFQGGVLILKEAM